MQLPLSRTKQYIIILRLVVHIVKRKLVHPHNERQYIKIEPVKSNIFIDSNRFCELCLLGTITYCSIRYDARYLKLMEIRCVQNEEG